MSRRPLIAALLVLAAAAAAASRWDASAISPRRLRRLPLLQTELPTCSPLPQRAAGRGGRRSSRHRRRLRCSAQPVGSPALDLRCRVAGDVALGSGWQNCRACWESWAAGVVRLRVLRPHLLRAPSTPLPLPLARPCLTPPFLPSLPPILPASFRWMTSLRQSTGPLKGDPICGAVLISSTVLLTAASCTINGWGIPRKATLFPWARLGVNTRRGGEYEIRFVTAVLLHSGWNRTVRRAPTCCLLCGWGGGGGGARARVRHHAAAPQDGVFAAAGGCRLPPPCSQRTAGPLLPLPPLQFMPPTTPARRDAPQLHRPTPP
jgi:hypothetical protein